MNRLWRSLLLFAVYLHLTFSDNPRLAGYIEGLCGDDDSIDIYFRNVVELKEQLNSQEVQEFLRNQLKKAGSRPNSASQGNKGTTYECGIEETPSTSTEKSASVSKGSTTQTQTNVPMTDNSDTTSTNPTEDSASNGDTVSPPANTAESTGESEGGTDGSDKTTIQPTFTSDTTDRSTGMMDSGEGTSTQRSPTTEAIHRTSDSMEENEVSTSRLPCSTPQTRIALNDTCKVLYEGKCFTSITTGVQDVTLAKANALCSDKGLQLGNIYDDCQYQLVMEKLVSETELSLKVWTGMTSIFPATEEDRTVFSSTAEVVAFRDWWHPENESSGNNGKYLSIRVDKLPTKKEGFYNTVDAKLGGAFCETG